MKQIDLTIGVLCSTNGVMTNGFTFYAPMKNNILMQFCATKVEYTGKDMERVKFSAKNSKGEITEFQYRLTYFPNFGVLESLPSKRDIKLYDSVDDFINNKPIKFYFEKHNVSFFAPYKSVFFDRFQGTRLIAYACYYRNTDSGVKENCGGTLADFYLRTDIHGNLWGKFIDNFSDNMYDSEDAAKKALRKRLIVEPLENKQSKHAPQISITINVCPSDSDKDILSKIKASL